jgi:ABC-type proline/glycine betaine transport system permease subunit
MPVVMLFRVGDFTAMIAVVAYAPWRRRSATRCTA